MKGSVGVMLYTMLTMKERGLAGTLQAHIVSDEERGADYGTKHVLAEIARAAATPGLRTDRRGQPAQGAQCRARIFGFRVRFIGRASHTAAASVGHQRHTHGC